MSFPVLRIEELNKEELNRILAELRYYLDLNVESKKLEEIRNVNLKNIRTEQELDEIPDDSLVLYRGDLSFKASDGVRKL